MEPAVLYAAAALTSYVAGAAFRLAARLLPC